MAAGQKPPLALPDAAIDESAAALVKDVFAASRNESLCPNSRAAQSRPGHPPRGTLSAFWNSPASLTSAKPAILDHVGRVDGPVL